MANFTLRKLTRMQQYIIGVAMVCVVSGICLTFSEYIGYRVIAFILLVTVSLVAMFFDIWPVLLAAALSALIWNFFFIPPVYTFHINNTADVFMFAMYFIIAMVNAALTTKIRQAEKKAQQKEEKAKTVTLYNTLLNSLSHELRTPIAAIIGATDNLQANTGKLNEANKTELISEISKASLRLNRQVENLLNMSRLETGFIQLKKDWCDINELLYDVVSRMKDTLGSRPVVIRVQDDIPLFKIDFGIMEQVLYNLIFNANSYIPKYCVITVRADCLDEKLVLRVEDNGEGFPPDEIDKVFEKFYRLKNAGTGGTGLGLSIVKGFVEAHNGTVQLENIPAGGAKFTIIIPAEISHLKNLKNE